MFWGTRATNFSTYTTKMDGAGRKILGTGAKFKRVPRQKSCRVNRAYRVFSMLISGTATLKQGRHSFKFMSPCAHFVPFLLCRLNAPKRGVYTTEQKWHGSDKNWNGSNSFCKETLNFYPFRNGSIDAYGLLRLLRRRSRRLLQCPGLTGFSRTEQIRTERQFFNERNCFHRDTKPAKLACHRLSLVILFIQSNKGH